MEYGKKFCLNDFSVLAKNLPNCTSVDDFDGCLYLFEPEYMDKELLQFKEWTTRLQNEIWSHTAWNK